jgi:mRNA interferase MazF
VARRINRGELWTAAGGPDYAGKPRPVVVLQDDRFEYTASITVCPLTTNPADVPLFRPSDAPDISMLDRAVVVFLGLAGTSNR